MRAKIFNNYMARKLGLKHIRLHGGRHSHASIMLKNGTPLKVISERLGHSEISITGDLYAHVLPGMQEAEAQKFEDAILAETEKL